MRVLLLLALCALGYSQEAATTMEQEAPQQNERDLQYYGGDDDDYSYRGYRGFGCGKMYGGKVRFYPLYTLMTAWSS